MQQDNDLLNAFLWIYNHEEEIRNHYQQMMQNYKAKALEAGAKLQQL